MHFLSREIVTEAAVVSAVANTSPAPALIVLNFILRACVNALILTPLIYIYIINIHSIHTYLNKNSYFNSTI